MFVKFARSAINKVFADPIRALLNRRYIEGLYRLRKSNRRSHRGWGRHSRVRDHSRGYHRSRSRSYSRGRGGYGGFY